MLVNTASLMLNQKLRDAMLVDGINTIATVLTKTPAPAKNSGALRLVDSNRAPIKGETMANRRPQKLATPAAVPRIEAGNASGVHP